MIVSDRRAQISIGLSDARILGLRRCSFVLAFLIALVLPAAGSMNYSTPASARIRGTVVDSEGKPLRNISVHAFFEQCKLYVPTANSDAAGRFVIPDLEPGTYSIFGESDASMYPDTSLSFYGNARPLKLTLGADKTAHVTLVLGPKAGVLSGAVLDSSTGFVVASKHALRYIMRSASDQTRSIEFEGPPRFRWLIPPQTEVTLEVKAECYKPWIYSDRSNAARCTLSLRSAEVRDLDIRLQPDAVCDPKSFADPDVDGFAGKPQQNTAHSEHSNTSKNGRSNKHDNGNSIGREVFSDAVAEDLLQQIANGLAGHNQRLMLSAFDRDNMDAYQNFANQISAMFEQYDSFRIHFLIDQTSTEGDKGIAQVQIELEEIPSSDTAQPVRKSGELRFEMERGAKAWKIVDVKPRSFFQ